MLDKFVHLKIHSEYSLIDSTIKINSLIEKAKFFNMKSIAINDFFNFFGLIKFYEKCCNYGIKPIIGIDILIDNNDKYKYTELTILALNNTGYRNLIQIISIAYKNCNNYSFPIININLLIKYNEGIILLSGGINGYIGKLILNNDINNNLNKYTNLYLKYFYDRFYIEISKINIKNEEFYINESINISKKFSIPLVATNNVVFLNKNDFEIHKIRTLINEKINYKKNIKYYTSEQYFKNSIDMINLFKDIPESIINTIEISKRCNVILEFDKNHLPNFYKKYNSINNYFKYITNKKLDIKINEIFKTENDKKNNYILYKNRLKKEIDIINKMGYCDYFLIVMEFINWAKINNIPVGPGRGSGTGSLVSFVLGITELDPIKFNLIFERFLNPERLSMPDLDIDFCVEKRDLVIDYVIQKYGRNLVSKIITFSTLTAKSAIKDIGRILGYTYNFVNKISKLIPNYFKLDNIKLLSNNNELYNLYKNDENVKNLIDTAIKLEGIVKNIGKHAGGIVISPCNITDFVPLYLDDSNKCSITQFDKYDIEKVGLIKFDFLGLKTLTIIKKTIDNINNKNKSKLDICKISLNDKKSFYILKNALTNGVFQLESEGIKKLILKLKPNKFEDIISLIALFRPGPLKSGMVDKFINRKNGKEKIYYPYKNLENEYLKKILSSTYGIILYQEQIIEIVQKISNYTLSEADLFRIAISKKNINEIKKQKERFISRAISNNINEKLAENIFNVIEKFSGYGFNKSHSVAYALISYRTLWLKANFTEEYICSVMNSDINNINKINLLIKECNYFSIKVNKIDINISKYEFYVNNKNEIEFGIGSIKGIGENSIKYILNNREKNGIFKNFLDFSKRINLEKIGKNNIDILIKSGAFDNLTDNKYFSTDKLINLSKKYFYFNKNNQIDIFEID